MGLCFAAVLKGSQQVELVLQEMVASFTSTLPLSDKRYEALQDALIQLCIQICPMDVPLVVIRTDPVPGFKALVSDGFLYLRRIMLEPGQAKDPNKNPVAGKAIQRLAGALLCRDPLVGALAIAITALNWRIWSRGLSSWEMWTQQDLFANHLYSRHSKAPRAHRHPEPALDSGEVVYLET